MSNKSKSHNKASVLFLAQFSFLLALEAMFCFTPLGSIPITPVIVATLMMVPVIITALTLGTAAGTLMGFFAGLFSFAVWTFMPPNPAVAFVFTPFYQAGTFSGGIESLIICFVPRILAGTVSGALYKLMEKAFKGKKYVLSFSISAALGSLTNTFLVLGGIWLFFKDEYVKAIMSDDVGATLLTIVGMLILTNGLPEAAVSAVVCPAVCIPVRRLTLRRIHSKM